MYMTLSEVLQLLMVVFAAATLFYTIGKDSNTKRK